MECELTQTDAGAFLAKLPEGKHDFDLMRMTFPDPNGLSRLVKSPGRWNHYGNPKLDLLLDQADATMDADQRMAVLQEVQKIVLEDAAIIPLFSDDFMIAARQRGAGLQVRRDRDADVLRRLAQALRGGGTIAEVSGARPGASSPREFRAVTRPSGRAARVRGAAPPGCRRAPWVRSSSAGS